jgi:integrase
MIYLPSGCRISDIKVVPGNWKTAKAELNKPWYYYYRFYDDKYKDTFPKGKLVLIRGMNRAHDLKQRQQLTRLLIERELSALKGEGFHPIENTFIAPKKDGMIDGNTFLPAALEAAVKRLRITKDTMKNYTAVLKKINPAIDDLGLTKTRVGTIQRKHIIAILDNIDQHEPLTNVMYNAVKKKLSALFSELGELQAITTNPVSGVKERKAISKIKELPTTSEIKAINSLKDTRYTYWRFIQIFANSGARTPELLNVRCRDVDLVRRQVKYTIEKDKTSREHYRPIKDVVLPLWRELVEGAAPDAFVFGRDYSPGKKAVSKHTAYGNWQIVVKQGLGVKAEWYSLKALNTDTMAAAHGIAVPAALNSHGVDVALKHYAPNEQARVDDIIRQSANALE